MTCTLITLPISGGLPWQWTIDRGAILTLGSFLPPLLLGLTQGQHHGWDALYVRVLFAPESIGNFVVTALIMSSTFLINIFLP
jgi:hypothetical protein